MVWLALHTCAPTSFPNIISTQSCEAGPTAGLEKVEVAEVPLPKNDMPANGLPHDLENIQGKAAGVDWNSCSLEG